jgi:hypothetical protein
MSDSTSYISGLAFRCKRIKLSAVAESHNKHKTRKMRASTHLVYIITLSIVLLSFINAELFDNRAVKACTGIKYVSKSSDTCDPATTSTSMCVPGMECLRNDDDQFKCVTSRYYTGTACKSSTECYKGMQAPQMFCGTSGTCVFYGDKYEGDSCQQDIQCYSQKCTNGKCVAKAVGDTCSVTAGTADFCTEDATCALVNNVRTCVALNKVNAACNVANAVPPSSVGCLKGLVCVENVCVRPKTKIGDVCDQTVAGHCGSLNDVYCRKNATSKPAPTFSCTEYVQRGGACDTTTELKCLPGLNCVDKVCVVPIVVCQSDTQCSGGEKCYCGGKNPNDGTTVDGLCGTAQSRNCKHLFTKVQNCANANCNPLNTIAVVADANNCMTRSCRPELLEYYNCVQKDVNNRGVSMPGIQGINSGNSIQTTHSVLLFVIATIFIVFAL